MASETLIERFAPVRKGVMASETFIERLAPIPKYEK